MIRSRRDLYNAAVQEYNTAINSLPTLAVREGRRFCGRAVLRQRESRESGAVPGSQRRTDAGGDLQYLEGALREIQRNGRDPDRGVAADQRGYRQHSDGAGARHRRLRPEESWAESDIPTKRGRPERTARGREVSLATFGTETAGNRQEYFTGGCPGDTAVSGGTLSREMQST